jgi:hypothetical protein
MKHKLLYSLLFLVILASGCIKSTPVTQPQQNVPSGTFSGEFKLLHRHTDKVPFDSLKANITVNLLTPDLTYTVTGDTATVHAGSYGTFNVSYPYILFTDKTYSLTAPYTKTHLSGYYLYNYDGTNLLMYASSSDTLVLGYSLKKVSN